MGKLQVQNLTISIKNEILFQNLSFTLGEGEIVGLFAPTGRGKTTLLNLIAGLANPAKYAADGNIITNFNKVSYVFQDSVLLPELTVLKNVMLPSEKIYGKEEAENKALQILRLLELDHKCGEKTCNLSGGEKQRAAIARAFLFPGELILMDEPFHAQDETKKNHIIELTKEIITNEHRMAIVVSHDKSDLEKLGASIFEWE